MDVLIPILTEVGITGPFIAYLAWLLWHERKRNEDLTNRLVAKSDEDAERFTRITLSLERILMAVQGQPKQ